MPGVLEPLMLSSKARLGHFPWEWSRLGNQQGLLNEMKLDRDVESVLEGFLESLTLNPVNWSALAQRTLFLAKEPFSQTPPPTHEVAHLKVAFPVV